MAVLVDFGRNCSALAAHPYRHPALGSLSVQVRSRVPFAPEGGT
jgi:hypothetical protein